MASFADRVAARAEKVRLARVLLVVIVAPFWLVGFLAALVWLVLRWIGAAVVVGFTDVTSRHAGGKRADTPPGEED